MKQLEVLDYLKLNGWQKFLYNLKCFFCSIPGWFLNLFKKIGAWFKKTGIAIWENLKDLWLTFKNGRWQTKVSFLIMGFGSMFYGQALRGSLFLLFEIVFVLYMVFWGGTWLSKFGTLGTLRQQEVEDPVTGEWIIQEGDDSFKILLYGILSILFILALVYTWRLQIKQCRINEEIMNMGKKVKSSKDDLKDVVNRSITQTLTRSIFTSLTTFIMVACLYVLGVTSIRDFALPLMVGIICGAYSSVCIAGGLWYVLRTRTASNTAKNN